MNTHTVRIAFLSLAMSLGLGSVAPAARAAETDADRQAAIQKMAQAFVAAFEKEDAKAIASFWVAGGDYVDLTGRVFNGRQEIEDTFAESFAQNEGIKVRIEVASLRFPSATTAIEDGASSMLGPDGSVISRAHYTNVLVQQDGAWKLASVRESPYIPPSNYEVLRPLEWAIGVWEHDATEGHIAGITFEWTPDNNFITSTRYVRVNGEELDNGSQTIAWDAAAKKIKSFSFESDGGIGQGVWTQNGQSWTIATTSVLRSGSTLTSTNTVTRVDDDTITVKTTDQRLDGKPLPDGPAITMKRVG